MTILRVVRERIEMILFLMVLPLVGVVVFQKPVTQYLEFPPTTVYVEHPGFSWPVFVGLAILILAVVCPFLFRVLSCRNEITGVESKNANPFPWWGWCGLALTAISWFFAWTRFSWFEPLQKFTFSPIWFGYIIVVNALTFKRTGRCLMRNRTGYFVALFFISAFFWWYFEYLNRFVQNWHYRGVEGLSPLQYFLFATLPFSTVLPAILGTNELLSSFPRASAGLDNFIRIRIPYPRVAGILGIIVFAAGLAMIGILPNYMFPLLWVSPLFIITSLQAARGRKTIFAGIRKGQWRRIYLLALSALVCGLFWEMWNYYSSAKWIYLVPFVNRFKIFEMPLLGYAGYLPFGLECAIVAALFTGKDKDDEDGIAAPGLSPPSAIASVTRYGNSVILALLAAWFFLVPGARVIRHLSDPALGGKDIPRLAWSLHRDLTPRYEKWAIKRVDSKIAADLYLYDVPDTEWPMFGSVYYLWATENLQAAWEQDNSLSKEAPMVYARDTIDAAIDLIMDPGHHTWVRRHWGDDYMHDRNVFFRSLIIAGLTSHEKLIGNGKYTHVLKDQIDTLAGELAASPHGVLDDYPDECYPIDVLAAIACIQRADQVLGTDHSEFIDRSIRAFQGDMLDSCGLIPYRVDDLSGRLFGPSRGVGNSYALIFAPELWPEVAREWYARYEEHFWQDRWWAAGFREFPMEIEPEFREYVNMRKWYDVDAGPIIGGFSPAANAFGFAAAKVNGRLDQAYTLGSQIVAATWPLPDGSLLGPRILSDSEHAPYLGEACLLYFLSVQPDPSAQIVAGGRLPGCVYLGLLFYFGIGAALLFFAYARARKWRKKSDLIGVEHQKFQFAVWIFLLVAGLVSVISGYTGWALLFIIVAQSLPQSVIRRKANMA